MFRAKSEERANGCFRRPSIVFWCLLIVLLVFWALFHNHYYPLHKTKEKLDLTLFRFRRSQPPSLTERVGENPGNEVAQISVFYFSYKVSYFQRSPVTRHRRVQRTYLYTAWAACEVTQHFDDPIQSISIRSAKGLVACGFDRARNETRTKGEGKEGFLPFFRTPSPLFYLRQFSTDL